MRADNSHHLRRRLEVAGAEIRWLRQQLREQPAWAHGERRTADVRGPSQHAGAWNRGRPPTIGPCSSATTHCSASRPVALQPIPVDTDRRDATIRLTLNPRRTPARGPDGWPDRAPAGCCCAPSPTRPRLGAGPSAASLWGFGPTVTIDG